MICLTGVDWLLSVFKYSWICCDAQMIHVPDERKSGGAIVGVSGVVIKYHADATITLADGCKIRLLDITDLSIG